MKTLFIFYNNILVGKLIKDIEGILSFEYVSTWLNNQQAFPISLSMPLQKKPFKNRKTRAFFENLMPEGDVLNDLEKSQKAVGVFEFMENFGQDCAGAITIQTESIFQPPAPCPAKEINLQKIYSALQDYTSIASEIANQNPGYLSIAGAQDKFPCIYNKGRLLLPSDQSPTTHIVKAPIWRSGVTESVFNEYFCMQLAHRVGLNTSKCHILEGEYPLFISERYDREQLENGTFFRLHQEDLCQAQEILATHKYENNGGPSILDNYNFLKKHTSPYDRFLSLEQFLKWIAFNLIIGNNDSHSKNISILLKPSRGYLLAPFYDLLSTAVYPKLVSTFSFKIGERHEFSKIGKTQLLLQEECMQLSKGVLLEKFQQMAELINTELPSHLNEMHARWPHVKVFKKITALINKRLKSLHLQKAIDRF